MSHFAEINEDNIVQRVIVADQSYIDTGTLGDPNKWIQTSYNTWGNQHPENRPFRKNFAGIGFTYDPIRDAFIPPQPFPSWILDEATCLWHPPVPYPTDTPIIYRWNEDLINWEPIDNPPITE